MIKIFQVLEFIIDYFCLVLFYFILYTLSPFSADRSKMERKVPLTIPLIFKGIFKKYLFSTPKNVGNI